jgi:hypothetical protein
MPKTHSMHKVDTRLSKADFQRLVTLSVETGETHAEIMRQAIRWYINNRARIDPQSPHHEIVQTITGMTDRICAMLARQGVQVGTLWELAWQSHVENGIEQRFIAATTTVKQGMRKKLTDDERSIAEKMSKGAA